jgi:hypothetical protein
MPSKYIFMVSDSKPSLTGSRRRPVGSSPTTQRWPTSRLPVKVGVACRPEAPIVNAIAVVTTAAALPSPAVSEVTVISATPEAPPVVTSR